MQKPSESRATEHAGADHASEDTVRGSGEHEPLIRGRSREEHSEEPQVSESSVAGGTVLGIHNLAIVMPQFIV